MTEQELVVALKVGAVAGAVGAGVTSLVPLVLRLAGLGEPPRWLLTALVLALAVGYGTLVRRRQNREQR